VVSTVPWAQLTSAWPTATAVITAITTTVADTVHFSNERMA
jgi:hypothetical protein